MTDIDLDDLDARLKRWFAGLSYEKFGPEHAAALLDALAARDKRIEELEARVFVAEGPRAALEN